MDALSSDDEDVDFSPQQPLPQPQITQKAREEALRAINLKREEQRQIMSQQTQALNESRVMSTPMVPPASPVVMPSPTNSINEGYESDGKEGFDNSNTLREEEVDLVKNAGISENQEASSVIRKGKLLTLPLVTTVEKKILLPIPFIRKLVRIEQANKPLVSDIAREETLEYLQKASVFLIQRLIIKIKLYGVTELTKSGLLEMLRMMDGPEASLICIKDDFL